jgi:hypothetical protein
VQPTPAIFTIDGLPAHPLVVHAVVVLLPLAAAGGLIIAVRPSLRRRFGLVVLALAVAGVGAVPVATQTGNELSDALPSTDLIETHEDLGNALLPFAIAFGIAVALLVIAGRLADRERDTAAPAAAEGTAPAAASKTWRRITLVAAVLVALTGAVTTVQVVRVGHSGAAAVWDGLVPS